MVWKSSPELRHKVLLGKLVALLFFLSLSFGELIDRVVASVNGEPILESDIRMAELYYGIGDREELLKRLIEINLLYQFLVRKGLNIPDQKVDELVLQLAEANHMSPEELAREFLSYGLTLKDFKEFLKKDIIATQGVWEYLRREVRVSEIELELAKLKEGLVKVKKEVEIVVLPKEKGKELLERIEELKDDLEYMAEELGGEYEVLVVEKGDLLEELDRQVWRAKEGEIVFAEDEEHIYVARVVGSVTQEEGDEEELREKLLQKKLREKYEDLLRDLVKKSVITVVEK